MGKHRKYLRVGNFHESRYISEIHELVLHKKLPSLQNVVLLAKTHSFCRFQPKTFSQHGTETYNIIIISNEISKRNNFTPTN